MRDRYATDDGFSLTEIWFVVVVISVLVLIAVPTWLASTTRAESARCASNQRTLMDAVPVATLVNGGIAPQSLADLAPFVNSRCAKECCGATPVCPLVYDMDTGAVTCKNHPIGSNSTP